MMEEVRAEDRAIGTDGRGDFPQYKDERGPVFAENHTHKPPTKPDYMPVIWEFAEVPSDDETENYEDDMNYEK